MIARPNPGHHPIAARRARRGAATVEAVIALPVFLLIFIFLSFMFSRYRMEGATAEMARRCAWKYSWNNCQSTPECVVAGVPTDVGGDIEKGLRDSLENPNTSSPESFLEGVVNGLVGKVIADLFGNSFVAISSAAIDRPKIVGGSTMQINGTYVLPCNLKQTNPLDVAKDAAKRLLGLGN